MQLLSKLWYLLCKVEITLSHSQVKSFDSDMKSLAPFMWTTGIDIVAGKFRYEWNIGVCINMSHIGSSLSVDVSASEIRPSPSAASLLTTKLHMIYKVFFVGQIYQIFFDILTLLVNKLQWDLAIAQNIMS